jgi:hypothetical protein
MQWRVIASRVWICSAMYLVRAAYAADREEAYDFYQFIRESIHEDVEKAIKGALSASRLRSSPTTDKEFEDAVNNTVKRLAYNKAYIAAQCVLLAPKGLNRSKFIDDCSNERGPCTPADFHSIGLYRQQFYRATCRRLSNASQIARGRRAISSVRFFSWSKHPSIQCQEA